MNPFHAWSLVPVTVTNKFAPGPVERPVIANATAPSSVPAGGRPAPVLLVSAYFPLNKSKHSLHQSFTWLQNFYGQVATDLYVFVPPDMEDGVRKMRGQLPMHINTTFALQSDVPVLADLRATFEENVKIDFEACKHNPALYMVWAAKPYFVREAMHNVRASGRGVGGEGDGSYRYVFWVDAGSMREKHSFAHWPDVSRLDALWAEGAQLTGTPKDDLLLIPIEHPVPSHFADYQEKDGPIDERHNYESAEGSLFGGSPKALEWWMDAYFSYLRHWAAKGLFVGKDQSIMNSLFVLFPERFITVWNRDPRAPSSPGMSYYGGLGYCGDPWFYYFFWLSNESERDGMNTIWAKKWQFDFWHGRRLPCRGTNVLAMDDVLKHMFGSQWQKPHANVPIRHEA
ncbi:hypothetical protein AURDEDRAFT_65405 [Auricularia subglabra TFB-10046 SS5]|nr:hypothetical protein AURDEDRAFT_65405 [Auricularia subglabra TFB-10046 SS5]